MDPHQNVMDPQHCLWLVDLDPGGPITCGFGYGTLMCSENAIKNLRIYALSAIHQHYAWRDPISEEGTFKIFSAHLACFAVGCQIFQIFRLCWVCAKINFPWMPKNFCACQVWKQIFCACWDCAKKYFSYAECALTNIYHMTIVRWQILHTFSMHQNFLHKAACSGPRRTADCVTPGRVCSTAKGAA